MSAKHSTRGAGTSAQPTGGGPPWVLIGGIVAVVAVGGITLSLQGEDASQAPAAEAVAHDDHDHDAAADSASLVYDIPTAPHSPRPPEDAPLPPLPMVQNLVPRSPKVVSDAYAFAARNPDVLEYIPCFCGCESAGHKANASCFVAERNADGSVRSWDTHGMACTVCVDVATDSMRLHASGASVADIRAAIEAKYASRFPSHTPTPAPPHH